MGEITYPHNMETLTKKKTKILFENHKEDLKNYIVDNNASWKLFVRHCKDTYGINKNYATELWKACWEDLEKVVQKRDLIKAEILINRLEDIFTDSEDDRIRLSVIEQLRKIGGVDTAEQLDISMNINVSFDEDGEE